MFKSVHVCKTPSGVVYVTLGHLILTSSSLNLLVPTGAGLGGPGSLGEV